MSLVSWTDPGVACELYGDVNCTPKHQSKGRAAEKGGPWVVEWAYGRTLLLYRLLPKHHHSTDFQYSTTWSPPALSRHPLLCSPPLKAVY